MILGHWQFVILHVLDNTRWTMFCVRTTKTGGVKFYHVIVFDKIAWTSRTRDRVGAYARLMKTETHKNSFS